MARSRAATTGWISPSEFEWDVFIGRALGYVCLHLAEMRSKTLLEQAEFLRDLGLPRREAAAILRTTEESLAELARQRAKRQQKEAS